MKLTRLTAICLIGALVGLGALAGFGQFAWHNVRTEIENRDRLFALHEDITHFGLALDYVVMLRRDMALLDALEREALALAGRLRETESLRALQIAEHLEEIVLISRTTAQTVTAEWNPALVGQLRIHQLTMVGALEEALILSERTLWTSLQRVIVVLVSSALGFGALCVVGFALVNRRLSGPLRKIEAGVLALDQGQLDSRIALTGRDELASLADCIDAMAAHRQQHEAQIEEQETRFRELAENIGEVFWLTDVDKREMLYVSPSYETVWGQPREALYADPGLWLRAIHADDRPRILAALPQQPAGTYSERYRVVRPDGGIRWIADRAFPVRDDAGTIRRIAGLAADVTHQVTVETQLRERIKEMRCLYAVLALTNTEDRPVEGIYQEIAQHLATSLLHVETAVARLVMDGNSYHSAPWRDPVVVLHRDVTRGGRQIGRVEIGYVEEPAVPAANGSFFLDEEVALLGGVVHHIEQMLARRQMASTLARTQRMEAVGQLTGGLAHDFNNLLTVILGNAELLQDQLREDAKLAALPRMIVEAAERGAELTRHLLAFARRQALAPREVDVNQLLAGVQPLLRRTLGEHIELKLVPDTTLWPALVDPTQLESAVLNLVLNARDAMPIGGQIVITTGNEVIGKEQAGAYRELEPGAYVRISVSDTGAGIAAEHLDRVFEPFFSTKEPGKGTGLGLSMVYGFVKQSRGHVSVYSEPGFGTTVKLYVPRAGADAAVAAAQADQLPVAEARGGETILLVEDDALVRRYARDQLTSLGYAVLEAETGHAALSILRRRTDIQLLFTDVVMPGGMSGRQLADAATRLRPELNILFTSGYSEDAFVNQGRLDPGILLLQKPYRRAALAEAVRRALKRDGTAI